MPTPSGAQIPITQLADIGIIKGPPAIKSENARLNGWTYVDIEGRDLGSYVVDAQQAVREQVDLPTGYSIAWSARGVLVIWMVGQVIAALSVYPASATLANAL